MTPRFRSLPVAAALAMSMAWAQAGGLVEVRYVQSDKFTDFGVDARETEYLQRELSAMLRRLAAAHLPDGQTLELDVLDVDRVGKLWPVGRGATLYRVVRSPLDWPRIQLRFTLRSGERILVQGEDWVEDMNFQSGIGYGGSDELASERRMLRRWFVERLARASPD
jgi:hypothetical protein